MPDARLSPFRHRLRSFSQRDKVGSSGSVFFFHPAPAIAASSKQRCAISSQGNCETPHQGPRMGNKSRFDRALLALAQRERVADQTKDRLSSDHVRAGPAQRGEVRRDFQGHSTLPHFVCRRNWESAPFLSSSFHGTPLFLFFTVSAAVNSANATPVIQHMDMDKI